MAGQGAERGGARRRRPVVAGLDGELGRGWLSCWVPRKSKALAERCAQLLDDGRFPAPSGLTPAEPWPLFCDPQSSNLAPTRWPDVH